MNQIIHNNQKIVSGSILDRAIQTGTNFAEAFLECDAVIIVDVSASMDCPDAAHGQTRFAAASQQLERLQNELPGRVAVCSFSDNAKFCASGLPRSTEGSTDMVAALEFLKDFDDAGIKLILISDGEPNEEAETLAKAREFKSKLDTVFVGSEMSAGREFLRQLSAATGGVSICQDTKQLEGLSANVRLLLGA